MAPSGFFAESPAMVLPPHHTTFPNQYFHEAHYQPIVNNPSINQDLASNGLSTPYLPPTPSEGAIAGRKRSRDDIYSPGDEHMDDSVMSNPTSRSTGQEPVYGPGMTLTHPNDPSGHYSPDRSFPPSAERGAQVSRPIVAARKSQRLDSSAARIDETSLVSTDARPDGSEPLIDEASRLLGISWSRMDATESTQIAQRAYKRWIQRHYPALIDVELWFENSAIPGYLGKATNKETGVDEFYLWSFDLHQAILVTRQASDLVLKLSSPHMSLSQATDKITADIVPVVEATAANAAILHNDRFLVHDEVASSGMEVD